MKRLHEKMREQRLKEMLDLGQIKNLNGKQVEQMPTG